MQKFDWLSKIKMVKRTTTGLFSGPRCGMKRRHFVKIQHYARRVLPLLSSVFLSHTLGDARHCSLGFGSTSRSWQVSILPKHPQFSLFFFSQRWTLLPTLWASTVTGHQSLCTISRNEQERLGMLCGERIRGTLYCAWRACNSNFMVPRHGFITIHCAKH